MGTQAADSRGCCWRSVSIFLGDPSCCLQPGQTDFCCFANTDRLKTISPIFPYKTLHTFTASVYANSQFCSFKLQQPQSI
jgi:hypothetical protein